MLFTVSMTLVVNLILMIAFSWQSYLNMKADVDIMSGVWGLLLSRFAFPYFFDAVNAEFMHGKYTMERPQLCSVNLLLSCHNH